jgi:hypothetical protein
LPGTQNSQTLPGIPCSVFKFHEDSRTIIKNGGSCKNKKKKVLFQRWKGIGKPKNLGLYALIMKEENVNLAFCLYQ